MNSRHTTPKASGIQAPHFTDYLRLLSKRRWTGGLALLVVFVYGTIATLKKTEIYEASAQLVIEKEAKRSNSLNSVLTEDTSYYEDDFYPTQVKILQSKDLAFRTLTSMGLNTPSQAPAIPENQPKPSMFVNVMTWVKGMVGAPAPIAPPPPDQTTAQANMVSSFLGGLQIRPLPKTRIVEVAYQSADPAFAQRAANAVVDAYIARSKSSRSDLTGETTKYMGDQLAELEKKVRASSMAVQQFQEANGAIVSDDRNSPVNTKLAELSARTTSASSDRLAKELRWRDVQALQSKGRDKLETYPGVLNNLNIQQLMKDKRQAEQDRDGFIAKGYLPKHLDMQAAEEKIKSITAKLHDEEDKFVESVRLEAESAQNLEAGYQKQQSAQNAEALSQGRKDVYLQQLKRAAAADQKLYDDLLALTKESNVSSKYEGTNISILDRAALPRAPIYPNTRRDLIVSFFEGCVLALALVFGFEYLDSRIKTPDELKTHLGLSFLGIVPSVSVKGRNEEPLLLHQDVPPGFAEALRAVRTSVIFSSAEEGARAVVITSTAPGEGKTVVSSNLAVALAQAGQLTLIVDGDMRRPRIHETFGRPQEPGLSNVLVGTTRLRDAVRQTNIPNLYVLPAGHIPPNPAELLGSSRYFELLDELRQEYEWILIDAPPVMAVTDAAVLANTATGVIFVVGAEMTSRRNAVAAVEQLAAAHAKFIGGVLNRVDLQRHSYYYSPYYRKDYARVYERANR